MVAPYIAEIQRYASAFRDNERNLPLYFPDFDAPPPPGSLNRVFGPPVGVTDADWPIYPHLGELLGRANQLDAFDAHDLRMEHVFTIDLRDIKLLGAPPRARAMMLFTLPVFLVALFFGGLVTAPGVAAKLWGLLAWFVLVALTIVIRNTTPRVRTDQAVKFFWGPVTVVALL